jgi:Ca2+-binding RTX toxin-like protein
MAVFSGTPDGETIEFDGDEGDIVNALGGNDRIRLLGYDGNGAIVPVNHFQINGGAGVDRLVLVNNFEAFTYVNLNGASLSSIEWIEVQAGVRAFFTSAQFAVGAIAPTAGLSGVEANVQITLTTAHCDLSGLSVTGSVTVTFQGSEARNVLHGNDGSRDFFWGMGGNDALYGHGGRDTLDGGEGIDRLFGGAGNMC